jgi:hypothetical protein
MTPPPSTWRRNLHWRASCSKSHGLVAAVADARTLHWRDGQLWHPALPGLPVDMVYNRLTDFDLSDPAHAALRAGL